MRNRVNDFSRIQRASGRGLVIRFRFTVEASPNPSKILKSSDALTKRKPTLNFFFALNSTFNVNLVHDERLTAKKLSSLKFSTCHFHKFWPEKRSEGLIKGHNSRVYCRSGTWRLSVTFSSFLEMCMQLKCARVGKIIPPSLWFQAFFFFVARDTQK